MRGYSLDLRLKVLAAVDHGIPRKEVVSTFGVSMPTLERYLSLRRQTGEIGPPRTPGRTPFGATANCGRASKGTGFPSPRCGEQCASWGGRKREVAGSLRVRRRDQRCLARAHEASQSGFVNLIGL